MTAAAAETPIDRAITTRKMLSGARVSLHDPMVEVAARTGMITNACFAVRAANPINRSQLPELRAPVDEEAVFRWQNQIEQMLTLRESSQVRDLTWQYSRIDESTLDSGRPTRLQVLKDHHNGAKYEINHRFLLTCLKLASTRMDWIEPKLCTTSACMDLVGLFRLGEEQPFAVIAPMA